jgi:hypothetical protein
MVTTLRADVLGTVPTIVAREIIKYTIPTLELWPRINMQFAAGISVGDRVQVPTYNDTASTPNTGSTVAVLLNTGTATGFSGTAELTPLVASYAAQTIGSTTIYVANWYYVAIELSAYAEATAQGDMVGLFKTAGMDTLPVQMDTTVATLISGLSVTVGTAATALTDDNILDGIATLDAGNVPGEGRSYVFSAQEKANYFKIDKYVNSLYRGDTKPLTRGELGNLYGMTWAWTTQVPVSGSGHLNVMFHRDTFGGITRKAPMARVAEHPDPQFAQRIVAMAIWGVNETRDRFGLQMRGL